MKKKLSALLCLLMTLVVFVTGPTASAATFNIDFELASAAATLVNLDTGMTVFEKEPHLKRAPASLTKIMTYIVVTESVPNPDTEQVTITKDIETDLLGTGSSLSGIKVGDVLSVTQLLYCMMIPSGNDAALALAKHVGKGDVQAFVDLMNKKAQELGCKDTHYMNPHGLNDEQHYTTASDMAVITQYAMDQPMFMDICTLTRHTYQPLGGPDAGKDRLLITTNMMTDRNLGGSEYYSPVRGIKTGSHNQAGYCLVTTARKDSNGQSYLCVVLGAPSVDANGKRITVHGERADTKSLYQWAFSNLKIKQLVSKDEPKSQVKLEYAWEKDTLLLMAEKDFSAVLPADVSTSSILTRVDKPDSVEAPVKKGDVIGTMTLSYAGQDLATVNLLAAESVERSEFLKTTNNIKDVLSSGWFIAIVVVIVILVIIYIILALIYNRKKKNLRKVKKYKKF